MSSCSLVSFAQESSEKKQEQTNTKSQSESEKKSDAAQEEEKEYIPHGKCILVCDTQTGHKIYSKGGTASINPYGFTKILTAITVIENHKDLDKKITVPKNILKDYDYSYKNIGLASGEKISVKDLLYALMLTDAGDCAIALAHSTGKSYDNFIKQLNQTAEAAGAKNSVFTEPVGYNNSTQKTTLEDMYKISAYAMKNETFKEIVSTSYYIISPTNKSKNSRKLFSQNKFISKYYTTDYINPNIYGVKGYHKDNNDTGIIIRYNNGIDDLMILVAQSDIKDNIDYVYKDVINMLENHKGSITEVKLIKKEEFVSEINLKTAKNTNRALVVSMEDIFLRLPKDYDKKLITKEIIFKKDVDAPLKKFEEIGEIKVYYDKKLMATSSVASYNAIEQSYFKLLKNIFIDCLTSIYFWIIAIVVICVVKRKSNRKRKKVKK